ncbi:MAG: polysaccharide deacetylase family protein [Solibacillus sp.]
MKKYIISNFLFTLSFLIIFTPLCYILYNYILSFDVPFVAAKEPLSNANISSISINRNFSDFEEYADKVTVLMYHQIIPENQLKKHHFTESGDIIDEVVTLEQFIEQMNYLKDENFTVLSLKEFESFMNNQKKVPAKSVLITFDDGYKNIFEFAYPILRNHGYNAVNFIITSLITEKNILYNPLDHQYASIEELKEAADVFDYENHTHSFHKVYDNGESYLVLYEVEKVKADIAKAKEWLGNSIAFAAPYGNYNTNTLDILRELDIKMAFTIKPGYAESSQHILEIPRQGIYPFYALKDFKYILEQSTN